MTITTKMKKVILITLVVVLIFLTGCTQQSNEGSIETKKTEIRCETFSTGDGANPPHGCRDKNGEYTTTDEKIGRRTGIQKYFECLSSYGLCNEIERQITCLEGDSIITNDGTCEGPQIFVKSVGCVTEYEGHMEERWIELPYGGGIMGNKCIPN